MNFLIILQNSSNDITPSPFSSTCFNISFHTSSSISLPIPSTSLISSASTNPFPSYLQK